MVVMEFISSVYATDVYKKGLLKAAVATRLLEKGTAAPASGARLARIEPCTLSHPMRALADSSSETSRGH
jgi:hypothetical protein